MIDATELGRFEGYRDGYDLPLSQRKRINSLAAATDVTSARTLARIISDACPGLPRGFEDRPGRQTYAEAYRVNFLDGAARRK